jgi:hypothetical protein
MLSKPDYLHPIGGRFIVRAATDSRGQFGVLRLNNARPQLCSVRLRIRPDGHSVGP